MSFQLLSHTYSHTFCCFHSSQLVQWAVWHVPSRLWQHSAMKPHISLPLPRSSLVKGLLYFLSHIHKEKLYAKFPCTLTKSYLAPSWPLESFFLTEMWRQAALHSWSETVWSYVSIVFRLPPPPFFFFCACEGSLTLMHGHTPAVSIAVCVCVYQCEWRQAFLWEGLSTDVIVACSCVSASLKWCLRCAYSLVESLWSAERHKTQRLVWLVHS